MLRINGAEQLSQTPPHPVVTIGNFDGVHLGHREIIDLAVSQARKRGGACVVYTFRPHPQAVLRPDRKVQLLTTYEEKAALIAGMGADLLIEEPFGRRFSNMAAEEFFRDILLRRLSAEAIVVGYDFGFGRGRQGHLEALGKLCEEAGVELTIVPPKREDGEVMSSSAIREHLLSGRIREANRLLGYSFFYQGVVIRGAGRGRTIGFPTANLKLDDKLALPYGVYATWAELEGEVHPSVTNVGVRPTFRKEEAAIGTTVDPESGELAALVETYLIDRDIDLYGRTLKVSFVERIRDEKKFSGVDELKAQIARDVGSARSILGAG